ncbi:MAG: 2-oxoglutarate dehydrogenase E1 component [Simkania sp.]|nr:2-oxoglutarate dehydrogenase E1 component [Simkania sp.]
MQSFYHLETLEALYQQYLQNPDLVESSWRCFFEGWELGQEVALIGKRMSEELQVYPLIEAYRSYGHLIASFNPVGIPPTTTPKELDLKTFNINSDDLIKEVSTWGFLPEAKVQLIELIEALKKTYSHKIGIEYMGLGFPELELWVQKKIEPYFKTTWTLEERTKILHDLNRAELFETFIHTKYAGQKRFSLEGGETLIPMLANILDQGSLNGISEIMIGMAHRGRLNVLANILEKSYAHIFHEFEDHYAPDETEGAGDVKYHKGFIAHIRSNKGRELSVTLSANPSHLESVDPVVEGGARAFQITKSKQPKEVLPVLIHGDASIAGQGIVYETMQMSKLPGYSTGGTLHIVINNQIGFTTLPKEGRSTRYCTDIAKAFSSPVFHVNAEDPEGCVLAAKLAVEIRQTFACDVFIDLNCYRKYGHNEGDEPAFTQPLEYQQIRSKKSIREIYLNELLQKGVLSTSQANEMEEQFKMSLQEAMKGAKAPTSELHPPKAQEKWVQEDPKTAVPIKILHALAKELTEVPQGFEVHPKIRRLFQEREMSFHQPIDKLCIDWANAESLAYATLLQEGVHVRISGQDSRRGTFSHRHAMIVDQKQEGKYFPLSHLKGAKTPFDVYNSPLSEFAVLGFEFGYSLIAKDALVIWEAQYGDFANSAQIMTDQYIASSEQKWGLASSITLFLPHGYEGQGPEHSSARMERFLQLSAESNLRIANVTTPAQVFHLLRLQALSTVKKPLILFTPKALLRHPLVLSTQKELESGNFEKVLDDPLASLQAEVLIFCSGKIYYDLFAERQKRENKENYAFIRLEMLHPFDDAAILAILQRYQKCKRILWVQEEPANMGAYSFIWPRLNKEIEKVGAPSLEYAGRAESASTAVGSYRLHKQQYEAIMKQVF